jgi:fructose-specific phosphotransferase system IIA component
MKRLYEMITKERIIDLRGGTKQDCLQELVDNIALAPEVTDKNDFYISIMKREKIMSTGIGIGLAVPHVKIDSVKDFVMAIGRKKEGIDFDSLDGRPVHLVIMIGANTEQRDDYLKVLAKISILLKNSEFREKMIHAKSPEEIIDLLKTGEK